MTLLRKKFTEELESPTTFLRALLRSPVLSYFQFFYELHGQLFLVIFFLKLGKTNSLKIERAIWQLYFPSFLISSVQRIFGWKLPSKLFNLKGKLCWMLPKVCSENTTELFLDFYSLEKAALWINKKLMKEIKYLRLEYLRKKWQEKKHEKDHFNNVQKYGQLAGPEVEARS